MGNFPSRYDTKSSISHNLKAAEAAERGRERLSEGADGEIRLIYCCHEASDRVSMGTLS